MNPPKPNQGQPNQEELFLQELQNYNDPRYGKITLFMNPNTEAYFTRKQKKFDSMEHATHTVNLINYRINSPNLYYVPPLTYELEQNPVDKTLIVGLYMPFPEEDLRKEITRRAQNESNFGNKEITFLMYDVLNGLYHLQILGLCHGRVNPLFIARTTTGYAVIDDPFFDVFDVLNLKEKLNFGLYLSPESLSSALDGNKAGEEYDLIKSDVFSFGLLMLEAAILENVNKIFKENFEIEFRLLEQMIHKMKCRYPENNLLTSTIVKMLERNPEKRPDFKEIFEKLPEYDLVKEYFSDNPEMSEAEMQSMKDSMCKKNPAQNFQESIEPKNTNIFPIQSPPEMRNRNIEIQEMENNFENAFSPDFGKIGKIEEKKKIDEETEDSPEIAFDSTYAKACNIEERDQKQEPEIAKFFSKTVIEHPSKPVFEKKDEKKKKLTNKEIIERKFDKWKKYQEMNKIATRRLKKLPSRDSVEQEDAIDTPTRTKQLMKGINQQESREIGGTRIRSFQQQSQVREIRQSNPQFYQDSRKIPQNNSRNPSRQTSRNIHPRSALKEKSPIRRKSPRNLKPKMNNSLSPLSHRSKTDSIRRSRMNLPQHRILDRNEYTLPYVIFLFNIF